jgi:hypothetical protein
MAGKQPYRNQAYSPTRRGSRNIHEIWPPCVGATRARGLQRKRRVLLSISEDVVLEPCCRADEIAQLGPEKVTRDDECNGPVVWTFATQVFRLLHHFNPLSIESRTLGFDLAANSL